MLHETAFAKINLALHVRARRGDGYHDLETLFGFVDSGDEITIDEAPADELYVSGEFSGELSGSLGNLAALALGALTRPQRWRVQLDKRLPIAAGVGGGSADAGAIFRLVDKHFGLPEDWAARAARLGADVPACVHSRTMLGYGTGAELIDGPQDLAGTPVLLVNPRVPLSTASVFAAWDGRDRGELACGAARDIALGGRNDLERPAIDLCPAIGTVLDLLRQTDAWLVRMSGSGATCAALFHHEDDMQAAAAFIRKAWPDWWQMAGRLR